MSQSAQPAGQSTGGGIWGDQDSSQPDNNNDQPESSQPRNSSFLENSYYDPKTKNIFNIPLLNDVVREYKKNPNEWPNNRNLAPDRLCIVEKQDIQ